jgi:hypothetical protein
MRKLFRTKRRIAVTVGTVALAAALGGAAFAYFTSTGIGTGSGTVGTSTPVTLTGITISGLMPGTSQPIPYLFTNTGGTQTFGTVSGTVSDISPAACTAAIAQLSIATSADVVGLVAAGAPFTPAVGQEPVISMGNSGNQNDCQSATFTITLNVAAGS